MQWSKATMDPRNLAIPLLAFAGGAILGRLFGLKTLARGAMTAAAVTGMVSQPALVGSSARTANRSIPARRRTATRTSRRSRRRPTHKKSNPA
jgi:hypothetical protein